MKSTTMKQLIANYNPPEKSNREAKKPSNQGQKYVFKSNNIKEIKNPSVKSRKKPNYLNTKRNILKNKNKSSSRTKKLDGTHINKNKYNFHNNNNLNTNRLNMNKTICSDANGNIIASIHERNLSAPSLKCEKKNDYYKKKKNIIKLIQKNKKIDDNLINKDNYNEKIEVFNSFKNKNNNNNLSMKNKDNSLIKVNLNKINLGEEDDNEIHIYNYNYNSSINHFYKNINKKKPNKNNTLLDNSEFDISNFNKDIENIKNIQETISLLKEQLKDGKKKKDNYYNNKINNKKILNYTINTSNSTTINNTSHNNETNPKIKNKLNNRNNYDIINNNYAISNFHNYNQNVLNKNNQRKNINKTSNTYLNNISITSNDVTPNKNPINTARINSQNNNNNLSNSSNNKTVISISTTMTNNNINNNNGFGKKINLSSIYGGQNDKDDKDINSLKDNSDVINNSNNDNDIINYNIDNERAINIDQKKEKEKEKEKENYNNNDDNKKEEKFINNIKNNNHKNNNDNNKNKKNIFLQKTIENKNYNYMYKTPNTLSLKNQYNSFKNPKINKKEKDKIINKEIKDINNHLIQNQNKNNKKIFNYKSNNHSNLYQTNTVNNMNKNTENNSFNLRYNTINNDDHYNNLNYNNHHKYKNIIKSNVSYENTHKKQKNIAKMKFGHNSKVIETNTNNNYQESIDIGLKKRNSCKPYINNNEKNQSVNNNNENISASTNRVKKYLTKCDFKNKSVYQIAVICKAGEVVFGETKTNQDNYFNSSLGDDLRFIGVCDGHGEHGHHVSKFLREYLPKELEKDLKKLYKDEESKKILLQKEMSRSYKSNTKNNIQKEKIEDSNKNNNILEKMRKVFEKSFERTDKNLSEFCRYLANLNTKEENIFDVEYSGSTCISILLKEKNMNKIYIANVGDSRAIIIKETKYKYWTCQQLSRDHKPIEKDEAQRILDYDGEIEKIEDDDGNWTGPLRVWVKESDGPGLAMTRSFGDEVGASVGVISTPEVEEYTIKEEDKAIIIASDGLWEYMSNKEVTDIIKKLISKKDPNIIVNELYKESVKNWRLKDQGIDDITIICILLKSN